MKLQDGLTTSLSTGSISSANAQSDIIEHIIFVVDQALITGYLCAYDGGGHEDYDFNMADTGLSKLKREILFQQ